MSDISHRIKEIREVKKLSQVRFAKALGITSASISNYESGKRRPDYSVLNAISTVYHVNSNWLLTGDGPMFQELQPLDASILGQTIRLPIVAEIAAGEPCEVYVDEPLGFIELPTALLSYPPPYLVFRVLGRSMEPHILSGDIVVCSQDWSEVDTNGKIMAFRNWEGITLKKLMDDPKNRITWLMPINHEFSPTPYSEDGEDITMIGILDISIRKHNPKT